MPGPFELLIVGFLCGVPVVVAIVAIVLAMKASRSHGPPAENLVACPQCGEMIPPDTECPHCGHRLST